MMDCKHIDELLVEYLYQELEPSQVESFEAHLQSCARCASSLASYERTRAIVQDLPEVDPPARLDERILAEAERATQVRPARAEQPSFWQRVVDGLRLLVMHPAMTAAVTLVLVLGVSFYVYRSSSPRSARETPDEPYAPEVDRRLPGGSATISVREQPPEERTRQFEGRQAGASGQQQAEPAAVAPKPLAKAEPRLANEDGYWGKGAQRVVAKRAARRAKGAVSEEESGRRGLMPETANVLGKAGNAAGAAAAAPGAERSAKDVQPKVATVAKSPAADEAPTRASKSRDRADKGEVVTQKKGLDDLLAGAVGKVGKGGGKPSATSAGPAKKLAAVAPRKEEPRAKPSAAKPPPAPTPVAQQRVGKGKWRGKASSAMGDDIDALDAEGKAAYKGQLASKLKAPPSALAANEATLGDKARAAGRCDQALAHYNRAISFDAIQLKLLAGKVRACAAALGKDSEAPLVKAAKSYPALAGLLAPELERARRARAERAAAETQQVRGPKRAAKIKAKQAAPAKSDAYQTTK